MTLPPSRIDVPTIILHLSDYPDDELEHLVLELERCCTLLLERYQDKRILPHYRMLARNKLRRSRRTLAQAKREREDRGATKNA